MAERKKKKSTTSPKKRAAKKEGKLLKTVFMIMPFRTTPSRNEQQLTSFFQNNVKKPIETARLANRYEVRRSDNTFNITDKIVQDLYAADIVICDLSGPEANPNVMYELGMRLAFSNNPVILIREKHEDNRPIFDISGFFTEPYDPLNVTEITAHLIEKLRRFEDGQETYTSPVLSVLSVDVPLLTTMSRRKAATLLENLLTALAGSTQLFGGAGTDFIHEQTDLKLGRKALDFYVEIRTHGEVLQDLDWSLFSFRPASQPPVDHYISTRYLLGLVDDEVERAFTGVIMDHYAFFLSGDHMYTPWTAGTFYRYGVMTAGMVSLAEPLVVCLRTTDPEVGATAIANFHRNLVTLRNLMEETEESAETAAKDA